MTTDITIRREGDVEIITIDRPDVRNALRFQTYDELEAAVRDDDGALPRDHRRRSGVLLRRRRARGHGRRRAPGAGHRVARA